MIIRKAQVEKLIFDIKLRMAIQKTHLDVNFRTDEAIEELEFLVVLLKDINSKESLNTAEYIEGIIEKAKNGTYKLGD